MRILADECCDAGLVVALRADGHDILSVSSTTPGAADSDVLAYSATLWNYLSTPVDNVAYGSWAGPLGLNERRLFPGFLALTMAGDKAGAQAALSAVTGAKTEVAQYWLTYLAQRG